MEKKSWKTRFSEMSWKTSLANWPNDPFGLSWPFFFTLIWVQVSFPWTPWLQRMGVAYFLYLPDFREALQFSCLSPSPSVSFLGADVITGFPCPLSLAKGGGPGKACNLWREGVNCLKSGCRKMGRRNSWERADRERGLHPLQSQWWAAASWSRV